MRLTKVLASGSVLALAACATPRPGPDAAAARMQAPPQVSLATKPTFGQEAHAVVNDAVIVDFPSGAATLTLAADAQLDVAARLFRDASPVEMYVAGHSDNVGGEYSNLILSARRAEAVKKGLAARGIPADQLLIEAFGEARPINNAEPAAPQNRRVVITWRLI